ncbi:AAA family ATPase [Bradyrhizobium sp. 170]|uniref:AAA family ATPase n=1 Tax=Bradyrhizobium sp. 170 TaxID=2782641 RepID=UPI00204FBA24|nr:AAA family ATPase [Bradyrhizobium sp. 170]UPK02836.1 AAA family ATPase [Bradyrhizobium sp. 170]
MLVKVGVAVFPSSGKTPLVPMFNRLDTQISPADRAAAIEKYREEHDDKSPIHVGSTKDPEVVKRMWRAFRDAVPSIATGPSNLVVLDADAKDQGPEKMAALWEENGGLPEGVLASPTKSDGKHFILADPERSFTNKAGALKKNYGTDVRGSGGQIVAPGSLLDDGRSYGTRDDLVRFLRAYVNKTIPEVPEFIRDLIGSQAEHNDDMSPSKERDAINALQDADWEKHENDFDPDVGEYDLEKLRAENAEFRELYDNPSSDCSTNRFLAARHVMREWPDMPAPALSIFFSNWVGAGTYTDEKPKSGEYDDRQIAREWLKNQGLSKPSSGEAFGAVVDEDEPPRNSAVLRSTNIFENFAPAPDVIENLLPAVGLACIYADANVGKTFLAIEMLDRVMRGEKFFGLNTERGDVLLVAGEGQEGLKKRLTALHKMRPLGEGKGIAVSFELPSFDGKPSVAARKLKRLIELSEGQSGQKVHLVVLDNLIGMIGSGDLHTSAATKPVLDSLSELAHELGICIAVIHHENRSGSTAGSFAIRASVDVMLHVVEDKSGLRTVKVDKSRDGTKSLKLQFRLKYVPLGHNKWGNEIGSCVVEPYQGPDMAVTDDEEAPTINQSDRREDRLQAVLDVFEREGQRQKAADESPSAASRRIELQSGEIGKAVNARRVADGLDELRRSTVQGYILEAVKSGSLDVGGTKARPLYRLA